MSQPNRAATHPEDGDLVRMLDHQVSPDERRWLFAHLSECQECAGRMEALHEQSQAISRLIGTLDVEGAPDELTRARALAAVRRAERSHRRWYASGAIRAAAVVALAALVTLGVEPVRAWMVDRLSALFGGEAAAPVAEQPAVLERGSVISFEPAGEIFVLEIEHAQTTGTVTLELRENVDASAQVVDGGQEEILALPSGVRIANSSGSTASYHFTLPATLSLIQVFADGKPVAILQVDDASLPWSRTVSLDPAAQGR